MVFVSHSSKDSVLATRLVDVFCSLGIDRKKIFCSSVEGNGVRNGERINDVIKNTLLNSKIIIYLVSHNFLQSTYCMQEMGFMWNNDSNKYFIIKFDDVSSEELKGFIDSSYKYSLLNIEGLLSLYDELEDIYSLTNKQSTIHRVFTQFLEDIGSEVNALVVNKNKTQQEIEQEAIDKLSSQYEDLSTVEKQIIGSIYYSDDATGVYKATNGTVGLLLQKRFLIYASQISVVGLMFSFALQPWVRKFIKQNPTVQKELQEIIKKKGAYLSDNPYSIF